MVRIVSLPCVSWSVSYFLTNRFLSCHLCSVLGISFTREQPLHLSSNIYKGLSSNWGSKKFGRNRRVQLQFATESLNMISPEVEKELEPLRVKVKEQGDYVRTLKSSGASDISIKEGLLELKKRRKELDDMVLKLNPPDTFDRVRMADLIKRRFYYDNSFAIYGGITGQYDFGPMGCDIIDNILSEWHKHFVIQERMHKINCSILTPENVLKASGHVDKFADFMVKDVKTGECFRLDHLIKQHFQKLSLDKKTSDEQRKKVDKETTLLDGMDMGGMNKLLREYDMKSPITLNELSDPVEFNLMFPISIGPSGNVRGFLRPETAQGIFVNFKRLLECNQGRLPFASAQVGNSYRNEISPRSGLLRVREFLMAEIEHFCYPDEKDHPKFKQISDTKLWLYSACNQMDGAHPKKMTIGEAVYGGLVNSETLGYFMARIQQFMIRIGIDENKLRFRQHMNNEMAHYACDCWDAECLTSYGWIECVGCADRSAYDLTQHMKASGIRMSVERPLPEPRLENSVTPVIEKGLIGRSFKKEAKNVMNELEKMSIQDVEDMDKELANNGIFKMSEGYEVTRQMIPSVKREERKVHVEEIIPSVIEPSFGIGRIFYSLLEHTFRVREDDDKRTYFALPTLIAPIKVAVLPLSSKPEFAPFTQQIADVLTSCNISVRVDDATGSIGRRYVRADEIAIPFGITIDFDTIKEAPHSVTLRERDSTAQVRIKIDDVPSTIEQLSQGKLCWADVVAKWPKFTQQETTS